MVDNATTYDILLGAHWIHRIGGIINTRSGQFLYRPDWNTTGVQESSVPLYTYHSPQAYDPNQANLQCYQDSQSALDLIDRLETARSDARHLAMEWEYQLEERQLEREERQDATVEVLQRWQEQQTVRRLRQANGGEGSSRDGELASVAATRISASTSTLTFRSASAIVDILRSREYRTSRTSTADLHATREAFQTQRQHIHQWFYNYNMRQREGPQTER